MSQRSTLSVASQVARTIVRPQSAIQPSPRAASYAARYYSSRATDDGNSGAPTVGPARAFVDGFMSSVRRQVEENKQLKENVKLLADSAEKISEADSIKRAREIMEKANKESSAVTSQAIKKTGEVAKIVGETINKTVEIAAESPIGKAATETVKVVGSVAEAAVKPITTSEMYKQVTSDLAAAIQEGSSRYGGITSKQVRNLIKQKRLLEHQLRAHIAENPDATGMVLHAENASAWKEAWDLFKETNPIAKSMFNVSKQIAESDNLVVNWGKWIMESIQDRFGGIFEETETAKTIAALKRIDPTFNMEAFMKEVREFIVPEVVEAWLAGDRKALETWCSEASAKVLTAGHAELVSKGLESASKLVEIKGVDMTSAKLLENNVPVVIISFQTQEILLYRDKISKEIVLGKEDVILRCAYVLVLTLDEGGILANPVTRGWKVIDQAKQAGGSMV